MQISLFSDWKEPETMPTNAHAIGFNPSITVFTVRMGQRIASPSDSQVIKLAEKFSWASAA